MRRSQFAGVDGTRDQHYSLALREQWFGLRGAGAPRIGELLLDGDVAVEVLQRVRRGDHRCDERPPFGTFPEFFHPDAVTGLSQFLEVGNNLLPIEHGTVGSDLMPEVTLR